MLPRDMQAHADALVWYAVENSKLEKDDTMGRAKLAAWVSGSIQAQVEDPDYDQAEEIELTPVMTREQAYAVLTEREGTPPEHLDACSTESLIAAAQAPAGQPCTDCGKLVVYRDEDWHHVETPTACFLARQDER